MYEASNGDEVLATGRVMVVGSTDRRPDRWLVGDVRHLEGPLSLTAMLAWPAPAQSGPDDVILALDSLDADPETAVDQILGVAAHAAYRVLLAGESDDALTRLDALEAALRARRNGRLARIVRASADGDIGDRLVLVKRRIGHLVLVAGPSAAGKSSLIKNLLVPARRGRQQPGVYAEAADVTAARLDIGLGRHWAPMVAAKHLHDVTTPYLERLLVQYDFSLPARLHWPKGRPDPALDVLECASRASVITVWTPADRLQVHVRQRAGTITRLRRGKARAGKLERYKDPAYVQMLYDHFDREIAGRVDDHHVVEIDTRVRFHDGDSEERPCSTAA